MSQSGELLRRVGMEPQITHSKHHPDVVVIGGGLAGLTAAATVTAAGKRVLVLEKRGVVGGDARSMVQSGFTLNQGPHALYRGGPAERILTELGVKLNGGAPPVEGRIVFDGETYVAPAGPSTLLQTKALGVRDKVEVAKMLGQAPKFRPSDYARQTVSEWIDSMVTRERPRQLAHMLTRLTSYANHPDVMSAEVAAQQIQLGLGPGVLYLDGGWQTLVDQLLAKPGVEVRTGEAVTELPDAPAVIIAGGGPTTASKLLGRSFDVGPSAQVSCIDLGLRRPPDHDIVLGGDAPFYFSNHSGVADLAPKGHHLTGAMQYLAEADEPDPEAIRAIAAHAGVTDDDIVHSRKLHRMTAVSAVATAELGGLAGRPKATDTGHDNVFLAGDWVGPEGHLADAAIASGRAAADAALRQLAKVAA